MKQIIHVNQHIIKANRKNGTNEPVLTCKTYRSTEYAHEAILKDENGNEIARVVYRKDNPLSCGAHVWIEFDTNVVTLETITTEQTVQHLEITNDVINRYVVGKTRNVEKDSQSEGY